MELTQHRCRNCGGSLIPFTEGKLRCQNCGSTFEVASAEKHTKQMKELFDDAKQEVINNLRRNLYNATRAEYVSSSEVHEICVALKQYLPDDFQANFYDVASGANTRAITEAIRNIDTDKHYEDLDGVISYLIGSLQTDYLLELNNLVERAYRRRDLAKFEEYSTAISEEAEKVQLGIYETKLPREVFVAYSSKDMDKVSELVRVLESQNLSCFVAARNLRHGKGAVENYNRALEEAMDHCKTFVFVSSSNSRSISCDALEIEIPYVQKVDLRNTPPEYRNNYATIPHKYKKPRVEYRINDSTAPNAADIMVGEFFDGYEHAYSPTEVARRILKQRLQANEVEYEAPKAAPTQPQAEAVKYCAKCGHANPIATNFCAQCGNTTFLNSVADFIRDKERAEAEAARKLVEARMEAERQKEAARIAEEKAKQQTTTTTTTSSYTPSSTYNSTRTVIESDKNPWVAFFLCMFLGIFGAHRFYVGKKVSGGIYLFTLGGFVFGFIVDLFRIAAGKFDDEYTMPLQFKNKKPSIPAILIAIIFSITFIVGFSIAANSDNTPATPEGETPADGTQTVDASYQNLLFTMSDGGWAVSVAEGKASALTGAVEIPSEIQGTPVLTIPENAFLDCTGITSITVPDSVQTIEKGAFSGCTNLKSISLPFVGTSRTATGSAANFGYIFGTQEKAGMSKTMQYYSTGSYDRNEFYIPGQLSTVTITDTTQLPYGAFNNCTMIKNFDLTDKIVGVAARGFDGCTNITELSLPNITAISNYMLANCSSLASFEIGSSVTSIGEFAFKNCASLSQVSSSIAGDFVLHEDIQTIGKNAFSGCIKMKSLTLPFLGNTRTASGSAGLFGFIFGTEQYTGGTATMQYYNSGSYDRTTYYIPSQLKSLTVTDATQLSYGALNNCATLETITLTEDLISVGARCFAGCSSIEELDLPNITAIANGLFEGCASLKSFDIGDAVTSIGEKAFSGCIALSRIDSNMDGDFVISSSVKEIGKSAFKGCLKMKSLTLPFVGLTPTSTTSNGVLGVIFGTEEYSGGKKIQQYYNSGSYDRNTYYFPPQLKTVTVTDAISLAYGAFNGCSMLEEITLNASLEGSVPSTAFTGCTVTPVYS